MTARTPDNVAQPWLFARASPSTGTGVLPPIADRVAALVRWLLDELPRTEALDRPRGEPSAPASISSTAGP